MSIRHTFVMAILALITLTGCGMADYTLAKRSAIDAKIGAARAATQEEMKVLGTREVEVLNQTVATHLAREQAAADYLFKGSAVYGGLKTPTRPEMVMGQSIAETAAQLPPATPSAQAAAFKALQTELDETKISADQLRSQYEAELGKARAEGDAKTAQVHDLSVALDKVTLDRLTVATKANETEARLSDARKIADDATIAAKTKEAEDAKVTQAIRTKLSAIVGGLSLLCLAGAIWSPVFKDKFGAACAILALVAVGIWWIQPWHIALALGVSILALVLWAAHNHYIESKAATATYKALADIKTTARADYDRVVKPALDAFHTKYLKDGTVVPDPTIVDHIDQRLMDNDLK